MIDDSPEFANTLSSAQQSSLFPRLESLSILTFMTIDFRLFEERVTLHNRVVAIFIGIIGFALIAAATRVEEAKYHKISIVMEESGAALFISGVLAVLWELGGKRRFADEILAKANMSRDLSEAGIDVVAFFKDKRIDWEQLFKNASRLDIFVSYAHSWRNTYSERIDQLLTDKDAKMRVILPDPDNEEVLKALGSRFDLQPAVVRQEITEAMRFFESRKKKASCKGIVEIYLTQLIPLFTFYRFNGKGVFSIYNHSKEQIPVPAFVCNKDGFLFEFLSKELNGILDSQRTKLYTQGTGPGNA